MSKLEQVHLLVFCLWSNSFEWKFEVDMKAFHEGIIKNIVNKNGLTNGAIDFVTEKYWYCK